MKPVDEMTLEECIEEITDIVNDPIRQALCLMTGDIGKLYQTPVVIPATLDAAAELLNRLGWNWEVSRGNWWTDMSGDNKHIKKVAYTAVADEATPKYDDPDGRTFVASMVESPVLALYRVALAVLRATKKGASDGLDG